MKKQIFLAAVAATFIFFTACKKDSDATTYEESVSTTQELTVHQDQVQSADAEITYQADERGGGDSTCPTRTWLQPKGTYPNTLTIDYGTTGCVGADLRVRKGKVIVNLTGGKVMTVAGATRVVTHSNHFVDDIKVEGTKTLTNNGLNASGQPNWTRTMDNHKLTFPDGRVAMWSSTQSIVMTAGFTTPLNVFDDVFSINGSSSGTNRNGKTFATVTSTPLVKNSSCPWFVSGIKTLTLNGDKTVTINYGNGSCDKKAIITLPNGTTKEVTIKRWW